MPEFSVTKGHNFAVSYIGSIINKVLIPRERFGGVL